MGVFRRDNVTTKRAEPSPYGVIRPITASAKLIGKKQIPELASVNRPFQKWQKDAWIGYDRVGEIHYGFSVVANTLSRIRVYAGAITTSDEAPVPLSQDNGKVVRSDIAMRAEALMADFTNVDFSSLVRAFALNMSVVGECLLVDLGKDSHRWMIKSVDELRVEADKIVLRPRGEEGANKDKILATRSGDTWSNNIPIGRIWRQHPRFSDEPDSSMKAIAEPIEELLLLQRLVRSTTRSRLNNGLLFLPDGIVMANALTVDPTETTDEDGKPITEPGVSDPGNSVMQDVLDSIMDPIEDETATTSVVPMMLTGPGEQAQFIKHIQFERSSDQWLSERSERALERILQGIEMPKEIVTGLQNVKYANAMVIDEDFWKSNIEPLALVLCDALTEIYLRPTLKAENFAEEDIARVAVWYDPSEIVTRPNHAEDATNGFDRKLLSGEAWRREHGFSELDAPDEKELAMQLLLEKGSLPEDVTATLLQMAFPTLLGRQREENLAGQPIPFPESAESMLKTQETDNADTPVDTAPETLETETESAA